MEIAKALSYPLQDKNKIVQIGLIALIPIFGQIIIFWLRNGNYQQRGKRG